MWALPALLALAAPALAEDLPNTAGGDSTALSGYLNFAEFESRLRDLDQSRWAELRGLGKTAEGRDIWLLTVADDPAQQRPAILVVGNVHAPHVVGRELALRMAERIVTEADQDETVARFLSSYTIYFIACPSPDATEKNIADQSREVAGNATSTDDDRDFQVGEDPPVDLNGDGWITMMRVADPLGTHRPHPTDARVMIPVDPKKNERGEYRLYTESRDADNDKQFGEDGADGVDFNRNFTFNYPYFGRGAGPHQVSEPEARLVADFAFDHPNIAVVLCFSPEDNLFHPWKPDRQKESQRIKTTVLSDDSPYTDYLAEAFRKLHGGKEAPASPAGEGSFSEWAYFHFGRWTFASRAWWIPPAAPPAKQASDTSEESPAADGASGTSPSSPATGDTAAAEQQPKPLDKNDKRGAEELAALAWMAAHAIDGFVDWQRIEHPDFPGEQVEVGGFKPLLRLNPPVKEIDGLVQPHVDFLLQLSDVWPRLEVRDVRVNRLAPGLYDVQCRIVNTGYLPTMPAMGSVNRQWYPIQVTLNVPAGTRMLEGSRRVSVGRLAGLGGDNDVRWVFQLDSPPTAPSRLSVQALSPTLHPVAVDVELAP